MNVSEKASQQIQRASLFDKTAAGEAKRALFKYNVAVKTLHDFKAADEWLVKLEAAVQAVEENLTVAEFENSAIMQAGEVRFA